MEVVKRTLGLEQTEKWYVEDNDDLDDGKVPENLDPPPRFTSEDEIQRSRRRRMIACMYFECN